MINIKILKLASNTKYFGLKNNYTHKCIFKNKKCGDKISLEIIVRKNKICSMRYETNSCIYSQASANAKLPTKRLIVKPIPVNTDTP